MESGYCLHVRGSVLGVRMSVAGKGLEDMSAVQARRVSGGTLTLSAHGSRVIREAARMAVHNGTPLVMFATFTIAPEHRARFATGDLVLSSELRRCFSAMRERWRRAGRRFGYVWCAELPAGTDNLHAHALFTFVVPRSEFREFAAWLEGIWGFGWVKLERIRNQYAAAGYLLKAVAYVSKGADESFIAGRRYGVSRDLRCEWSETAAVAVTADEWESWWYGLRVLRRSGGLGDVKAHDRGVVTFADGACMESTLRLVCALGARTKRGATEEEEGEDA